MSHICIEPTPAKLRFVLHNFETKISDGRDHAHITAYGRDHMAIGSFVITYGGTNRSTRYSITTITDRGRKTVEYSCFHEREALRDLIRSKAS